MEEQPVSTETSGTYDWYTCYKMRDGKHVSAGYRDGRGELVCRVCGKEYRESTNK